MVSFNSSGVVGKCSCGSTGCPGACTSILHLDPWNDYESVPTPPEKPNNSLKSYSKFVPKRMDGRK